MTDTVLQSFCERCGTRYTVTEQDTRRESGLTKIGRSLGLRGAPKPPGEPNVANALPTHDPFKATFHFCLECRQYTCQDCWNPEAGFCQTCYPIGTVVPPAAERATSTEAKVVGSAAVTPIAVAGPTSNAWPTSDLDRAAASAAPPPVAPRPISEPADGPSPWGPGIADVPSAPAWEVAGEGDGDVGDEPGHVHGGEEGVAAAIPRDADGPTTDSRPDEAALWGSQAPSSFDANGTDAAPTQVIDPWRGVVFSYDEPKAAATEIVESPPQPDPDLPWLAKSGPAPAEQAADEKKREIDHRGWIAGSTIATGAAWSPPVPQWPDEAAAMSSVETDSIAGPESEGAETVDAPAAEAWDEPGTDSSVAGTPDAGAASPWVASPLESDQVLDEQRTPSDMRDPWVEIAALRASSLDVAELDEAAVEDSAEAQADVEGWPAVDSLATVDAIHDQTSPETAPAPDRIAPLVAAAAAGAVIGLEAEVVDPSPLGGAPEPAPAVESSAPDVAGPVGPVVPPWIPLEAPVGGSVAPVPAGPFASSSPLSPLPPQPPLAPIEATPTYVPPPAPMSPPAAPIYASAAPMLSGDQPTRPPDGPLPPPIAPPPVAPPPPLGMAAPPPASVRPATPHPAFVAPPLAMPPVGLQPSAGPTPPAPPMPMAAPTPSAQAQGPAGQTKAYPCQSCGLPLSAKARFCRRCGSQQAA